MPNQGLKDLYIDELKDLYNAENQLVKALPSLPEPLPQTNCARGLKNTWNKQKATSNVWRKSSRCWMKAPRARSAREWKA